MSEFMRGVTSGQSYKSISALLPSSCDITDVIYVRWARKISPGQQVRRIQRDFARLTVYRSLIGSPVSKDGGIVVEISTLFNWDLVIILLIGML